MDIERIARAAAEKLVTSSGSGIATNSSDGVAVAAGIIEKAIEQAIALKVNEFVKANQSCGELACDECTQRAALYAAEIIALKTRLDDQAAM